MPRNGEKNGIHRYGIMCVERKIPGYKKKVWTANIGLAE